MASKGLLALFIIIGLVVAAFPLYGDYLKQYLIAYAESEGGYQVHGENGWRLYNG